MSGKDILRLEALQLKHKRLDKQCKEGHTNYLNDAEIKKMKTEKAYIKAEIAELNKLVEADKDVD
jgi:uncharacterized protein YdcH (DUF465 family)|tara:strand:- start:382 stop:576 length:195 start_codon:yes stop_codon:yes gene_type:complete